MDLAVSGGWICGVRDGGCEWLPGRAKSTSAVSCVSLCFSPKMPCPEACTSVLEASCLLTAATCSGQSVKEHAEIQVHPIRAEAREPAAR